MSRFSKSKEKEKISSVSFFGVNGYIIEQHYSHLLSKFLYKISKNGKHEKVEKTTEYTDGKQETDLDNILFGTFGDCVDRIVLQEKKV